jgi:hypothetical protein
LVDFGIAPRLAFMCRRKHHLRGRLAVLVPDLAERRVLVIATA